MPQNVTMKSVTLDSFGRDGKGCWARFECSLTAALARALEWGELGDYETKVNLTGDLAATVIELIPADPGLKRQQVQIDVQRVYKFVATKQELEGSRRKGQRWVVQFDVAIRDADGCTKLEIYMAAVPESEVRVSYERKPVQADIPGTKADDNQGELLQ